MIRFLISIFFILFKWQTSFAQLSFTTTAIPSTCSANGSINVSVSSGNSPFYYQIISSSSGIVRPVQNVNIFNNLPSGTYTIRVTDINNLTATGTAVVPGNYIPLSFSHTQQQSSIIITPLNGKAPYTFSYSADGGISYTPPSDSTIYPCMAPGNYMFRVYDSCSNFYSENVVVYPVKIDAGFSCVADIGSNTKRINLDFIRNGNAPYSYHAFGVNYNFTNTTGSFQNINRCNKNISVVVTDKCNIVSDPYVVCPSPDYTFEIGCVNFKDHSVTITNVQSGSGLPYQYIANNVSSNTTTVQNFPIPGNEILAGLIDSCNFKNTKQIQSMKTDRGDSTVCKNGSMNLTSTYLIDGKQVSFPPTRYMSISGPSSFDVTDSTWTDSSIVTVNNLKTGKYKYKIINACGDEVIDSFSYSQKCFSQLFPNKFQSCHDLYFSLDKDCLPDTTVMYTLKNMNGTVYARSPSGIFRGLSNDSCYTIEAHELVCDTTVRDTIFPILPKIHLFENACNELSFGVTIFQKAECGKSLRTGLYKINNFVLADSLYNILLINTTGLVKPVPPGTYWVYATTSDCNSDTVRYVKRSGFSDTATFCITPTVRQVNLHQCKLAWNVKLMSNTKNITYSLIGNGINLQSNTQFYSLDTGRYILKDGCNEQELYLPNYYTFKTTINPGCPSNASVTAKYFVDSSYIRTMGYRYFFDVCNVPPMDYNISEIGAGNSPVYSFDGIFNNLKTGTYYNIIYKGNQDCNYFSDTVFTPFYKRPSITATYGLICNGNNATVKVSVSGGSPPYTYEVLNSGIPKTVTDSASLIYSGLPLGSASFRVYDLCGISTDYSTEVLSVNFQPTFKKKCNGQVQLIAPDIFNTTYVWTNKKGDTLGTTPVVYTNPIGDDTFTVSIRHLSCSISKTLFVSDFSASIVYANAGSDFSIDTTTTQLQGNAPVGGATGSWRQIDPSSGNTVFADIHDPDTKITVDVFPGQYTYVWSMSDTSIGCGAEDTVVVSFLRCPGIKPVLFTKTVRNAICGDNGQIDIRITQSSTRVHLLWNTGDTSLTLKNLKDSVYYVSISDETSCTPDIMDTTYITAIKSTSDSLNTSVCHGDTLVINTKKYTAGGNYTDTLINSVGCDSILFLNIRLLSGSSAFDSIARCEGEQVVLPGGQSVTRSGDYLVKINNSVGCDSAISYHISFHPVWQRSVDTSICSGLAYQLPAGGLVAQSGIYSDTLQTTLGCDSIIRTTLLVKDSLTDVLLGTDTLMCEQDHLMLSLNYPSYVHYLWQDKSTLPQFDIRKEGIYYVRVSDGCMSSSDTIQVQTRDCSCNFYVPNAFSPNNDGLNDSFLPINKCVFFKDYSFCIYNRLNELIFKTGDAAAGWDGYYNGAPQFTESYLWTLEYFDVLGNEKVFSKGSVILLK